MALADLRLAFLTFAQRWDGASLAATILVLPSGDPTQPLMTGTPAFAGAALQLRAAIIPSLDAMPALDTASTITRALVLNAPVNALELFGDLKTKFAPRDTSGGNPGGIAFDDRVRKALPDTYTALLPPGAQRDPNVASTEDFGCTLRGQRPPGIDPGPRTTTWGEVISHALRNPFLADALGLRYEFTLQGADAQAFAAGGWLYVTLDPADPYFAPWDTTLHDAVKSYAARIPALTVATPSRQLFCAVLFPVANPKAAPVTPDESEIDAAIIEAQIYDDGFAEMMHARQPDSLDAHVGDGKVTANAATDAGIQIGWDDEQVLRWHNRQIAISTAQKSGVVPTIEAPLGVLGYRVDVRVPRLTRRLPTTNTGWQSLMSAQGTVPGRAQGQGRRVHGRTHDRADADVAEECTRLLVAAVFRPVARCSPSARATTRRICSRAGPLRKTRTPSRSRARISKAWATRFACVRNDVRVSHTPSRSHRRRASRRRQTDQRSDRRAHAGDVLALGAAKGLRMDSRSDAPHAIPYVDRLSITRPLIGYRKRCSRGATAATRRLQPRRRTPCWHNSGCARRHAAAGAAPEEYGDVRWRTRSRRRVARDRGGGARARARPRRRFVRGDVSHDARRTAPRIDPGKSGQPIHLKSIVNDAALHYNSVSRHQRIAAPSNIPGAGPLPLPRSPGRAVARHTVGGEPRRNRYVFQDTPAPRTACP